MRTVSFQIDRFLKDVYIFVGRITDKDQQLCVYMAVSFFSLSLTRGRIINVKNGKIINILIGAGLLYGDRRRRRHLTICL